MKNISMTQKELAELAGYSDRQLRRINDTLDEDKKLFVKSAEKSGEYDLSSFIRHWAEYNLSRGEDANGSFEAAKTAHEIVKKRKTELEVEVMESRLVDAEKIKMLWSDICINVRNAMMRLPANLAPRLAGADHIPFIQDMIENEIRKVLEELGRSPLPADDTEEEAESEDESS